MVYKCSAFGCKSGYASDCTPNSITFHGYPLKNTDLCEKWIKANPRQNFRPTKHSKVCSLHFHPTDFMTSRTDTNASRLKKKSAVSDQPLRRILKEGAVPSIFPNAPSYLSTPTGPPRPTSKATPTSRREQQLLEMNILEESFRANDDISELSLTELSSRIQDETTAPSGFTVVIVGDSLFVYFLKIQTDNTPTIVASITVQNDFTIVVSVNAKVVPSSEYADLLKQKLRTMSQIINLMARVKAWTENIMPISFNSTIEMAIAFIEKGIEALDEDDEEHRKISFIIEQLHLLTKRKFGRQYSPQLTILSFLIHSASPAAYNVLLEEDILCFPSKSTIFQ